MKLKPLLFEAVDENTKLIYKDILSSMEVKNIPEIFRYMANFPDFFDFAWGQIKPMIGTEEFKSASNQLMRFSEELISAIYSPSGLMEKYNTSITEENLDKLKSISKELVRINAIMLIVSISIRESLKGIVVTEQNYITGRADSNPDNKLVGFISENSLTLIDNEIKTLYPDFYSLISDEIKELSRSEKYLKARVELEKITQMLIESFSKQVNFPFRETVEMLRRGSYSEEILLLLNTSFPSNYPHLLFIGAMMRKSLKINKEVKVVV